ATLRARRHDRPAELEGRERRPLPGRGPRGEPRPRRPRRGAGAGVRRPRQLLRRERRRPGAPHRLQLRRRAAARPLPPGPRRAVPAARREPPQPPRQARVPLVVLERAPAGSSAARARADVDERKSQMLTHTYAGRTVNIDPEGFLLDSGQWLPEMADEIA